MLFMSVLWRHFSDYSSCLECHFPCIHYLDVLPVSLSPTFADSQQLSAGSSLLRLCYCEDFHLTYPTSAADTEFEHCLPWEGLALEVPSQEFLKSKPTISLAPSALIRGRNVRLNHS